MSRAEVAQFMGYSLATLKREIERGNFPRSSRLSPNRVGWPLSVVKAEKARRDRHAIEQIEKVAVSDPAQLPDDALADALPSLLSRHLSTVTGKPVTPDEIDGVTLKLTDAQRADVAASAAEQQQALLGGIADRLHELNPIEALMLARAFLAPLRGVADDVLRQFGVPMTMSDDDWRSAALVIVERVINGDTIDKTAPPQEAAAALVKAGVLKRR